MMPRALKIGVLAGTVALVVLGCAVDARTQAVDHETRQIAVVAGGSLTTGDLGPEPIEEVIGEAAAGCAVIGDGLTPRLIMARDLGRKGGRIWVRYTFRCEFPGEPTPPSG